MTMFRALIHMLKIFIIFTICTLLFYIGLVWINQEYENYNRYHQPEGNAIKVNSPHKTNEQTFTIIDRLKVFFQLAE